PLLVAGAELLLDVLQPGGRPGASAEPATPERTDDDRSARKSSRAGKLLHLLQRLLLLGRQQLRQPVVHFLLQLLELLLLVGRQAGSVARGARAAAPGGVGQGQRSHGDRRAVGLRKKSPPAAGRTPGTRAADPPPPPADANVSAWVILVEEWPPGLQTPPAAP